MGERSREEVVDRYAPWRSMWQQAVRSSQATIGLVDLSSARFIELTSRAAELLGTTVEDGIGLSLPSRTEPPSEAWESMRLIRKGTIDGTRARRRLLRPDGSTVPVQMCGWAIRSPAGPDLGLWTAWDEHSEEAEVGRCLVVGVKEPSPALTGEVIAVDSRWIVTRASPGAEGRLSQGHAGVVGRSLIELTHPDDFPALLFALARATTDSSACTRIRLRDGHGRWRDTDVAPTLHVGDPGAPAAFLLQVGDPDRSPPSIELAHAPQSLRRIADQIEATNALAPLAHVSDVLGVGAATDLTPRQWEIVSRLLQGQRVRRIAADLYLSPSTVRNHLSAAFASAGVHSQDELVALFRQRSSDGGFDPPSPP